MDPIRDDWDRLEELFDQAMDLPRDQLTAFCAEACGDDVALRDFLYDLVSSAGIGDEQVLESISALATDVARQSTLEGERVGAYRLDKLIGRGGMGAVYLASRADGEFEKQVIVKLVRQKLNEEEFVRHFKTERQVLANLSHPYIPALVDAGQLADGRPYFVGEYVHGVPLDEYCDKNGLSEKQRLVLIEKLAEAVQHAHGKMVLHLDIKPANVLIESDGTPRLLDFGIARLMGDPDTGHKAFTPDYASPEQLRGESPTAASDIYSLGVLLYQLLAGKKPFNAPRYAPPQTKLAERAQLTETFNQPARLPGVDADLRAIVKKAMAEDVAQRYASVESLLLDLRNHRAHRPVSARDMTVAYQLRKYLRRHAVALTIATATVALLLAFGLREFQLRSEAQAAYAKADREAEAARQVSTFLTGMFKVSDPGEARGNSVTARELLDKGAERIADDLAGQPLVAGQLMHTMGSVYVQLGLYEDAVPLLDSALSLRQGALPAGSPEIAEVLYSLGDVHTRAARFDEAEAFFLRGLATQEKILGPAHPDVATSLQSLGSLYLRQGRTDEALAAHLRGIPIHENALGFDHPRLANHLAALGRVYRDTGRYAQSETLFLRAIGILERALGPEHPDLGPIVENLGNLYNQTQRFDEAETFLLRSLALRTATLEPDHPYVSYSLMNVAAFYTNTGKLEEAEEYTLRAIAIQEQAFEPDDYRLALSRSNLGEVYLSLGRLDDAQSSGLMAIGALTKNLEPGHSYIGYASNLLGKVYQAKGLNEQAEHYHAQAYAIFAGRAQDDANRRVVTKDYTDFLRATGREDDAAALEADTAKATTP